MNDTRRTYSCHEVAYDFGYSVNDVRRWAGSHGVQFSGNSYVWSQEDYEAFAVKTNYGKQKHLRFTNLTQADRYQNLYERYSHAKPSSDPYVNQFREYQQQFRKNAAEYLRKREAYDRGCLIGVVLFLVTILFGMCSIVL